MFFFCLDRKSWQTCDPAYLKYNFTDIFSAPTFQITCYVFPILFPGQCELYGEPHYISFQGVYFDFLDPCTYILAEERSPRHNLTVAVDNSYCMPGNNGSCAKDIILRYQNNIVILGIDPHLFTVQVEYNTTRICIKCHMCLFKLTFFCRKYFKMF